MPKVAHNVRVDAEPPKKQAAKKKATSNKSSVTAPLGTRSKCPVDGCLMEYKKPDNVRRHLSRDHLKTKEEIAAMIIAQTQELCPHCGKAHKNLWKHLRTCQVKNLIYSCSHLTLQT